MAIHIRYLSTVESCYLVNWFGSNYTVIVRGGNIIAVKNKNGQQVENVPIDFSVKVLNYHKNLS